MKVGDHCICLLGVQFNLSQQGGKLLENLMDVRVFLHQSFCKICWRALRLDAFLEDSCALCATIVEKDDHIRWSTGFAFSLVDPTRAAGILPTSSKLDRFPPVIVLRACHVQCLFLLKFWNCEWNDSCKQVTVSCPKKPNINKRSKNVSHPYMLITSYTFSFQRTCDFIIYENWSNKEWWSWSLWGWRTIWQISSWRTCLQIYSGNMSLLWEWSLTRNKEGVKRGWSWSIAGPRGLWNDPRDEVTMTNGNDLPME